MASLRTNLEESLDIIEDLKDQLRKSLAKRKKMMENLIEIQQVIEHQHSGSKEL
jgi:hypothetical protein